MPPRRSGRVEHTAEQALPARRSGRVAAAAEQRAWAFPQLPLPLALHIFLQLPADARLRCAEVCRGWRATVARPELWRRLDLSPASGVAQPVSPTLLHAAVARAGAALTALDVSDVDFDVRDLRAALRQGARAVEKLRTTSVLKVRDATALLAAAPRLRELHANMECESVDVLRLLARHAPFGPLRLRELFLIGDAPDVALSPAVTQALADASLQPKLKDLTLLQMDLRGPGALDAFVDVIARRRLHLFAVYFCALLPEAAPTLAGALRDGALRTLVLGAGAETLLDAAGAAVLGDALRASATITSFGLYELQLGAPGFAAVLAPLAGHRSLCVLKLRRVRMADGAAAGAALAALLAADAPALTTLHVQDCGLGEAGLGALLGALPRNSHLLELDISGNRVPAGVMRARLLPAVRANASLRTLLDNTLLEQDDDAAAVQEAQRIVAAR